MYNIKDIYSLEFADAVKTTLEFEGLLSEDSADRGGTTKYGISQRFLNGIKYHKKANELTKEEAIEIYHQHFWLKAKCNRLPHGIALFLFDYAVHSGTRKATMDLQRVVCNEIKIAIDGVIGNQTISAINTMIAKTNGYETVIQGLSTLRGQLFINIVTQDETQIKFYRGWMGRLWRITSQAQMLK